MRNWFVRLLLLLMVAGLASCRITHTYYSKENSNWQQTPSPTDQHIKYQVFLIGDAGEPAKNGLDPVLGLLHSKLQIAGKNSAVIYLGDNIYHAGLPDTNDPKRADAERRINEQLDILKDFGGMPVFIPGNHDWGYSLKELHSERVKRENAYIDSYLGGKIIYAPENGCPGPKVIDLSGNLALLVIDPDWLIEEAYREGTACGIGEVEFNKQLADAVAAAKGKNIIVAAHQPLFSTGPHSGYVGWKPHFFPLTDFNKKLYVPLPVLGSIYALVRAVGLSHQDLHNKHYKKYIKTMLTALNGTPNVVYVAGHEHTLEYFAHDANLHEVLSGAGSKKSIIRKRKTLGFGAYSKGFAVVKYYDNNEVWVEYWTPDQVKGEGVLLFRQKMYTQQ